MSSQNPELGPTPAGSDIDPETGSFINREAREPAQILEGGRLTPEQLAEYYPEVPSLKTDKGLVTNGMLIRDIYQGQYQTNLGAMSQQALGGGKLNPLLRGLRELVRSNNLGQAGIIRNFRLGPNPINNRGRTTPYITVEYPNQQIEFPANISQALHTILRGHQQPDDFEELILDLPADLRAQAIWAAATNETSSEQAFRLGQLVQAGNHFTGRIAVFTQSEPSRPIIVATGLQELVSQDQEPWVQAIENPMVREQMAYGLQGKRPILVAVRPDQISPTDQFLSDLRVVVS